MVHKILRIVSFLAVLTLLVAVFVPSAVLAINAPDDIDITARYVFRNLLEADDRLFVFEYNLEYAVYPTDYSVNQAFIFSLYDTDGTTLLGSKLAYPYWREDPADALGYGYGVVSFYFPDTPLIDWGEAYILTIQGNPTVLTFAPEDFILSTSDYTTLTSSADNKLSLSNAITNIATHLETVWSLTLKDTEEGITVLSSYGEEYFTNAITGLRALAPSLYYVQIIDIDMTRRVWGMSYANDLSAGTADDEGTTIDGSMIDDGLDAGGNLLGVNKKVFGSIICGVMVVVAMAFSATNLPSLWIGWVFSAAVVAVATRLSFIHMAFLAVFGLLSVVFIFWMIFGRNTG